MFTPPSQSGKSAKTGDGPIIGKITAGEVAATPSSPNISTAFHPSKSCGEGAAATGFVPSGATRRQDAGAPVSIIDWDSRRSSHRSLATKKRRERKSFPTLSVFRFGSGLLRHGSGLTFPGQAAPAIRNADIAHRRTQRRITANSGPTTSHPPRASPLRGNSGCCPPSASFHPPLPKSGHLPCHSNRTPASPPP